MFDIKALWIFITDILECVATPKLYRNIEALL